MLNLLKRNDRNGAACRDRKYAENLGRERYRQWGVENNARQKKTTETTLGRVPTGRLGG